MDNEIRAIFLESARVRDKFLTDSLEQFAEIIDQIIRTVNRGNKILLFGNGGSAADCQHIAAEFVNRYRMERRPLPALALTTDTSVMTAIGNDYSFEDVFAKQVEALGREGDVAIGISTSGKSANVNKALAGARRSGLVAIGIGGSPDSPMKNCCDFYLPVYGSITPRIQETHMIIGHTIVEILEKKLFGSV